MSDLIGMGFTTQKPRDKEQLGKSIDYAGVIIGKIDDETYLIEVVDQFVGVLDGAVRIVDLSTLRAGRLFTSFEVMCNWSNNQ